LSDEVESSGYFLEQFKRVLAYQQGISIEELSAQLDQNNGKTTLNLVLRGTNNPEALQSIFPPTLRRGDTLSIDLTEIYFETAEQPPTLQSNSGQPDSDPARGSYFETVQDATAGEGVPDWIAYYIDENDRLHVVLCKTMLESMTETSRETLFSRAKVQDRVAQFGVTEEQYWKDYNNDKGAGPAQRVIQLAEILGGSRHLPQDNTSETYDPLNPGGAWLKYLLMNNDMTPPRGMPVFPLTDIQKLVVPYQESEYPAKIPGYYPGKDNRLTFIRQ
jgi:hypothetical protein